MTRAAALDHRDQAVVDLIYHHPVAHNLPWRDVLTLMGHIGTAAQKHDGKWLFAANGLERTFHTPRGEHMDPDEVVKLRKFLDESGFLSNSRGQPYLGDRTDGALVRMVVVDHHGADVYDLRDGGCVHVANLRPHDPHHFLHHLTHRDDPRYRGQRAPEDPAFYNSLVSALQGADTAVLIGHGTGTSAAIGVLAEWLRAEQGRAPAHVLEITHTDTSAYTLPELAKLAREALREPAHGQRPSGSL